MTHSKYLCEKFPNAAEQIKFVFDIYFGERKADEMTVGQTNVLIEKLSKLTTDVERVYIDEQRSDITTAGASGTVWDWREQREVEMPTVG